MVVRRDLTRGEGLVDNGAPARMEKWARPASVGLLT
jgi:hypothetical protein